MVCRLLNRPDFQTQPSLGLPFYLHGVGHNVFKEGFVESLGEADFSEIYWMEKGSCEISFDERKFILKEGQAIFRGPAKFRRKQSLSPGGFSHFWVTFDGPDAETFLRSYGYPQEPLDVGDCPVELFEEIEQRLLANTLYSQRHMVSVLAEIIAHMGGTDSESDSHAGEITCRFMQSVREHYFEYDAGIEFFAEQLGISRGTLNRLVKCKTGITPIEYLNRFRLQKARSLLFDSSMPVAEVAQRVGIRRANYFCKLIRAKMGMTPTEYRRGHTSRDGE